MKLNKLYIRKKSAGISWELKFIFSYYLAILGIYSFIMLGIFYLVFHSIIEI